jgi:hypothetical protein
MERISATIRGVSESAPNGARRQPPRFGEASAQGGVRSERQPSISGNRPIIRAAAGVWASQARRIGESRSPTYCVVAKIDRAVIDSTPEIRSQV